MSADVATVLQALAARSAAEQAELEVLRAEGGSALRERAAHFMLDVGADVGLLLNMLVRLGNAATVVEVGGSVGYSTIWLAEAVRATGGRLYSIEVDERKQEQQRGNLGAAGLLSVVELVSVEAGVLAERLTGPVDLVLLDHWKELYVRDFDVLWPLVRPGGIVVADNITRPAKNAEIMARYREHVQGHPDARTLLVDVGDGLELTTKTP